MPFHTSRAHGQSGLDEVHPHAVVLDELEARALSALRHRLDHIERPSVAPRDLPPLGQDQLQEGVEIPLGRQAYADGIELLELRARLEGFEPDARVLARLTEDRGERTRGN